MASEEIDVLLVEDNHGDAELALRVLKKYNISSRVLHLENGAEALDYLFAEGPYSGRDIRILPRMILLDINMPKVNGIDTLKRIKADPRTKQVPVIMFTSSKEDSDLKQCYEIGSNSYVVKPVDFANFDRAMKDLGLYWMMLNQSPPKMQ
jgi:two-component system, response regulator